MTLDTFQIVVEVVGGVGMIAGGFLQFFAGRHRARVAKEEERARQAKQEADTLRAQVAAAEAHAEDAKEQKLLQQIQDLSRRVDDHFAETIRRFDNADGESSRVAGMVQKLIGLDVTVAGMKERLERLEEAESRRRRQQAGMG